MDQLEITAEVFRVVRANSCKSAPSVMKIIKEQIPEANEEQIANALSYIIERL